MTRDLDFLPAPLYPAEHQTRMLLQLTNANRSHIDLHMDTNVVTIIVPRAPGSTGCARRRPRRWPARHAAPSANDERVSDHQPREATEIPIRGPQFAHPVETAERGHAGVVHRRASDPALDQGGTQAGPVPLDLGEENKARSFEPRLYLIQRGFQRAGRSEDPRMGDNREELVDAGPRDAPGRSVLGELRDPCGRCPVPLGIFAVSVDEEIRIDRDHPPRPS